MPIDTPRVSIRDQDQLAASVASPRLLYAADGTGGASSSLPNLVVSLPTVATNEVVEISLPPVASLLPVVSLPTVAAGTLFGRKPTYGSNRPLSAIYNNRPHFWFGWRLIKRGTTSVDCFRQFDR